jgi:hypothetical protein
MRLRRHDSLPHYIPLTAGFRLKSLIGLSAPPSKDPQTAKTWILAHLLMILLLEPHTSAPEISPRMAA